VLRSVILTDDETEAGPLQAALEAAADPTRKYAATVLPVSRAAEIAWDNTALIIWHAALPKADDLITQQLTNHLNSGRSILFLPTEAPNNETFGGLHWGAWSGDSKPAAVEWWRNDTGLLANTRSGTSLPVGELEVTRRCDILGEGTPLARVDENKPLLMRADIPGDGNAWFLGTLTGSGSSSLARDGVVMFAMLHRALNEGASTLGKAQQREAAATNTLNDWKRVGEAMLSSEQSLRAGVLTKDDKLIALNRPLREDRPETLGKTALAELFAGLDHHIIEDQVENETSLASEIWRTFLFLMAIALLGEALLMPGRREPVPHGDAERAVFELTGRGAAFSCMPVVDERELHDEDGTELPILLKANHELLAIPRCHCELWRLQVRSKTDRACLQSHRSPFFDSPTTFVFNPTPVAFGVAFVVAIAGLAFMAWRRSGYRKLMGWLELLRVIIAIGIAITLLQPEWLETFKPETKPVLAVLHDVSGSMSTKDVTRGTQVISREETAKPLIEPKLWEPLKQRMDVVIEPFSSSQTPAAEGTDIHAALASVLEQQPNLKAVVLISDGDWNTGLHPHRPPRGCACARCRCLRCRSVLRRGCRMSN
jgi:hypothetical protein